MSIEFITISSAIFIFMGIISGYFLSKWYKGFRYSMALARKARKNYEKKN